MIKTILFILSIASIHFHFNVEEEKHDFHLSNSSLKYKAADNVLQLSIRVFIDDLESALKLKGIDSLYIGTEKEAQSSNDYIAQYLQQTFQIESEENKLQSFFLGKELSEDLSAVWCYVQFNNVSGCSSLKVTNTILTELFDDQKNIFTFSTDEGRKDYFTFDTRDKVKTFSCE